MNESYSVIIWLLLSVFSCRTKEFKEQSYAPNIFTQSENENVELIHGFLRFVIVANLMNTDSLLRGHLFIIKQMRMAIVPERKSLAQARSQD